MEKIWLITNSGKPIALRKKTSSKYSEDIKLSMMISHQRLSFDVNKVASAEILTPFNFRGRPIMMHLISIAAGIFVGGIMQLEPILSAIVLLTFAVNSLLFQIDFSPPHRLVRVKKYDETTQCLVIKGEDIKSFMAKIPKTEKIDDPTPTDFNDIEIGEINIKKYGMVTIICSISLMFLIKNIKEMQELGENGFMAWFVYMVTAITLTVATAGCIRIITDTYKMRKSRPKRHKID